MMNLKETLEYFKNASFSVNHPYANFKFKTYRPTFCGGTLCVFVWDLEGEISIDGEKWVNIEDVDLNDDTFTKTFDKCLLNDYGWVYQDIHLTLDLIIKDSLVKKIKVISISNSKNDNNADFLSFRCRTLSDLKNRLDNELEKIKNLKSDYFDIVDIYYDDEQIIVIDIATSNLPEIDLMEEEIPKDIENQVFDIQEKMSILLNSIGHSRFNIGKVHNKH